MTRSTLIALAAGGSLAALLGAWFFQYGMGLAPCHLCYLQRYPHMVAVGIGALALALKSRILPWRGAAAALTTSGIGVFHTGVERKWWEGPTSCSGVSEDLGLLSGSDLLSTEAAAPIIRCDAVAWDMFGLSMASYNALLSLALAGLGIYAATREA